MKPPVSTLDTEGNVADCTQKLEALLESLGGERRIDFGLERFRRALEAVGNPEKNVYTLVISGTNGKGSTALYLSAGLREAGLDVMTYLSPHLQHPRERFLWNLEAIGEEELLALAEAHLNTAQKYRLTYFEFFTLLVFVWAQARGPRLLVLEVGLGGRLDATNVTDPIACLLTQIGFDHMEYLGDTLESILEEKLGILRPESLFFTALREPELLTRIQKRCDELDAIYYFTKELQIRTEKVSPQSQTAWVNQLPLTLRNPSPGAAQNAALALLCLRIVFPQIPLPIIQKGFSRVVNPGRFEIMQENPRVILSGDHNPAGLADLLATLDLAGVGRVKTVCGFSPDKPFHQMYASLSAVSDEILLTQVSRARGKCPQEYFGLGTFEPEPRRAVETLMAKLEPHETLLITGSLYLVGEVRGLWKETTSFGF